MNQLLRTLETLIEPAAILLLIVILLVFNAWIFKRSKSSSSNLNLTKGAISLFIVLMGILVFILALPIDKSLKGQILGFLGIIISAGIALSSTTVLGNLIAGIMNNSMNRFRNGDLIKIGDYHGRVVTKSVFHTEIQLEDSNFITIPNLYIASNPVKLIRKTNTVISTSVSLGYDVSRHRIEKALKSAAISAGLADPYVYITSLGDYSVVYRIHGFLMDSSKYFSTNSTLNAIVMDKLHEEEIEIVSPSFMNQRRVDNKEFIPHPIPNKPPSNDKTSPEDLIFDKAIKSERIEIKKDYLNEIDKKQDDLKARLKETKDTEEVERIRSSIKRNDDLKDRLAQSIKDQANADKED